MYSIGVLEREERKQRGSPRKGRQNSSSFSPLSYIIQKAIYHVSCFLNFKRLLPVRPKEGRFHVDCGRGGCWRANGICPAARGKRDCQTAGGGARARRPFSLQKAGRGFCFTRPVAPSSCASAGRVCPPCRPSARAVPPPAVPPSELSRRPSRVRRPSRSAARAVPPCGRRAKLCGFFGINS